MKELRRKLRQEKWLLVESILPKLRKRYRVKVYDHHIRVKTGNGAFYDYYPKGERIGKCKYGRWSKFRDLSVGDFVKLFTD